MTDLNPYESPSVAADESPTEQPTVFAPRSSNVFSVSIGAILGGLGFCVLLPALFRFFPPLRKLGINLTISSNSIGMLIIVFVTTGSVFGGLLAKWIVLKANARNA